MKVRGQSSEAWLARWRQGTCPIHGRGLVAGLLDEEGNPLPEGVPAPVHSDDDDELRAGPELVKCTKEDCTIIAAQWPGKDRWHSVWGLFAGPDDVRKILASGGDIPFEGPRPGHQARMVRTGWPLGEDED